MSLVPDDRAVWRKQLRQRRLALTAKEQMAAAQGLAEQLQGLPELRHAGHVAGYWAIRGEISLHALLSPAPAFTYCLPCLTDDHHLRFAPWRFGDPLVQNRYGIPEPDVASDQQLPPEAMDVVLVPVVGFHRSGTRLGAGGGYYDRSFAFLAQATRPARPLLIGVGHDLQKLDELPAEPWDIPLDKVVTPTRVWHCLPAKG